MSNTELDKIKQKIDDLISHITHCAGVDLEDYSYQWPEDLKDIKYDIVKLEKSDNWIPIEDKTELKDSKHYSIQLKNGAVIFVEYLDHAGCGVDAGFIGLKNYYELDAVLFYQPLSEARK